MREPEVWRQDLHAWVERVWRQFSQRPEVLGLSLGGSIGRRQEHPGSDLELGILVKEHVPGLGYFNVIENRGIEAIQLLASEVEKRIPKVLADPTECIEWPAQIWRSRVVYDPSGLFGRLGAVFERAFVQPETILLQKNKCLEGYVTIRKQVAEVLQDSPATALAKLRDGFNALVCAKFWHHGRMPRSQNRVYQRLSALCAAHHDREFFSAFERFFALPVDVDWALNAFAACREQRLRVTARWGEECRNFFTYAVDPGLFTGDPQGITAVHRQYLPMIQGEGLDDPVWRGENAELLAWLDLAEVSASRVQELLKVSDLVYEGLQGPLAERLDELLG